MRDVISRQAAIDGVKTLHDVAWKNWHEPTLSANVVLDMIRELPYAQTEPHWIPCSERLPDKEAIYIVSLSGATDFCKYMPGIGFGWYSRGVWYKNNDVTAWMEMPEPYDEEDSNEKDL